MDKNKSGWNNNKGSGIFPKYLKDTPYNGKLLLVLSANKDLGMKYRRVNKNQKDPKLTKLKGNPSAQTGQKNKYHMYEKYKKCAIHKI